MEDVIHFSHTLRKTVVLRGKEIRLKIFTLINKISRGLFTYDYPRLVLHSKRIVCWSCDRQIMANQKTGEILLDGLLQSSVVSVTERFRSLCLTG